MAAATFGDLVKAVVDIDRQLIAVDAELHSDLEALLLQDPQMRHVKYSIFPEADFLYRLSLKDRFIQEILNDPRHITVLNSIGEKIAEAQHK